MIRALLCIAVFLLLFYGLDRACRRQEQMQMTWSKSKTPPTLADPVVGGRKRTPVRTSTAQVRATRITQ